MDFHAAKMLWDFILSFIQPHGNVKHGAGPPQTLKKLEPGVVIKSTKKGQNKPLSTIHGA